LEFYIAVDCTVNIDITYTAPAGSLNTQVFVDDYAHVNTTVDIVNNQLVPLIPTNNWVPEFTYINNKLFIKGLPRGQVIITVGINNELEYKAYFDAEGQLPGNLSESCDLPLLIKTISLALNPSEEPFALVSLLGGVAKLYKRNPSFLIPDTFRRWDPAPLNLGLEQDITNNLILALLVLRALYNYKVELPAQQLTLNTSLENTLVEYLVSIGKLASANLDIKTGLILSKTKGELLGDPSYIATACGLVLWGELYTNYTPSYLFIQSIYYGYNRWADIIHNPELESSDRLLLAQSILNVYTDNEDGFEFLDLDLQAGQLTVFDIKVSNFSKDPELNYFIPLPKASSLISIKDLVYSIQALEVIFKSHMIYSMPEGYLWATHELLKSPRSTFGTLFSSIATTLALTYKSYESVVGNYSAPGFYPGVDSIWFEVLFNKPNATPASFWQVWLHYFISRPGAGVTRLDWAAYYAGLRKFTVTLYDYQYMQLPVDKIISNYPDLISIDFNDPHNLVIGSTQDPNYIPQDRLDDIQDQTLEIVTPDNHLTYTDLQQTTGIEIRPLPISKRTNQITFYGMGRPHPVREALDQSTPIGVISYIKHFTCATAITNRTKGGVKSVSSQVLIQLNPLFVITASPSIIGEGTPLPVFTITSGSSNINEGTIGPPFKFNNTRYFVLPPINPVGYEPSQYPTSLANTLAATNGGFQPSRTVSILNNTRAYQPTIYRQVVILGLMTVSVTPNPLTST
jgi:hypothetical protein